MNKKLDRFRSANYDETATTVNPLTSARSRRNYDFNIKLNFKHTMLSLTPSRGTTFYLFSILFILVACTAHQVQSLNNIGCLISPDMCELTEYCVDGNYSSFFNKLLL